MTATTEYSEFRFPRQMLGNQEYDGHLSIHDDQMAEDLGFSGAPIEGPTHFSQFVPLLHAYFGDAWFETGCISAHYQNMVVEGEEVRAFIEVPAEKANMVRIGEMILNSATLKDSYENYTADAKALGKLLE